MSDSRLFMWNAPNGDRRINLNGGFNEALILIQDYYHYIYGLIKKHFWQNTCNRRERPLPLEKGIYTIQKKCVFNFGLRAQFFLNELPSPLWSQPPNSFLITLIAVFTP